MRCLVYPGGSSKRRRSAKDVKEGRFEMGLPYGHTRERGDDGKTTPDNSRSLTLGVKVPQASALFVKIISPHVAST